jgi:hypothetical protein
MSELKVGDAIEIRQPLTLRDEIRVVKMVLSDAAAGIK